MKKLLFLFMITVVISQHSKASLELKNISQEEQEIVINLARNLITPLTSNIQKYLRQVIQETAETESVTTISVSQLRKFITIAKVKAELSALKLKYPIKKNKEFTAEQFTTPPPLLKNRSTENIQQKIKPSKFCCRK